MSVGNVIVSPENVFFYAPNFYAYNSTENSAGLLLLLPKQTFSATLLAMFVVRPISSEFGDWTDPAQSTNTLYNSITDIVTVPINAKNAT